MTTNNEQGQVAVDLLPCPFCGGEANYFQALMHVSCRNCSTAGPYRPEAEAIAAWNTRLASTATVEEVEPVAWKPDPLSHITGWAAKNIDGRWCVGMDGNLDTIHDAVIVISRHGTEMEAQKIAEWVAAAYNAHPPATAQALDPAAVERVAKYADMEISDRAVAMADDGAGDPWELLGFFREKLRQSEQESETWKDRALELRLSKPTPDHAGPVEARNAALLRVLEAASRYNGLFQHTKHGIDAQAHGELKLAVAAAYRALKTTARASDQGEGL